MHIVYGRNLIQWIVSHANQRKPFIRLRWYLQQKTKDKRHVMIVFWELIKYVAAFDKLKDLDFNFKVGASFD